MIIILFTVVNVLQPKTTRNMPVIEKKIDLIALWGETLSHGELWGMSAIEC